MMKKRIIAALLAFVLAFSLFAGLGLFAGLSVDSIAKADGLTGPYTVVEIVPDYKYAQFAEAAGGSITVLIEKDEEGNDIVVGENKVISGVTGTCSLNGSTATVITYTPKDFSKADNKYALSQLRNADMFVIHKSAPTESGNPIFSEKFNNTVGTGFTSFSNSGDLTWEAASEIFKNIAGAYSTPARYVIEGSLLSGGASNTKTYFMLGPSSSIDKAGRYDTAGNTSNSVGTSATVYSSNICKLYMMLETMDPGTLYGIYFASHGYYYGINDQTGALLGYGARDDSTLAVPEDVGTEFNSWNATMLQPWFSGASNSSAGYNASMNTAFSNINSKRGFTFSGPLSEAYSDISDDIDTALKKDFTLDRKQYRILVVDPDLAGNVDQSLIGDFMSYANSHKISLVGGVSVTNMSMNTFINDANNLKESYDIVYFGNTTDGAYGTNRTKLYGSGKGKTVSTNNNTIAAKYLSQGYLNLPYDSNKLDDENKIKNSDSTKVYWNAGSSTTFASLDLTNEKKRELESFLSTKKVYYENGLKANCESGSNMSSLLNSGNTNIVGVDSSNFTPAAIMSSVDSFSVDIAKYPVLYQSKYSFDFQNFSDSVKDYLLVDETNTVQRYVNTKRNNSGQYITDDNHRTLDFTFYISGASDTYKAKLFVDLNNDGKFNETAVQTQSGFGPGLNHWEATPVRSSFFGAVYWKFAITDSSDNILFSKTGCSAYKRTGDKKTIDILQIVPDDTITNWADSVYSAQAVIPAKNQKVDSQDPKGKSETNAAVLLLPTNSEVAGLNFDDIDLDSDEHILEVERLLNGRMRTMIMKGTKINRQGYDSAGHFTTREWDSYEFVSDILRYYDNETYNTNKPVDNASKDNANKRADVLLANSGLFYYFMNLSDDYEMNVKRVSVSEFEKFVDDGDSSGHKFEQNSSTGKISFNGTTYDLLILGMSRGLNPMSSTKALNMLKTYICDKDLPTYIGGGAVKNDCTDELTLMLREKIGMDRYGAVANLDATGTSKKNGIHGFTEDGLTEHSTRTNGRMIRTNQSSFTMYPYNIPYMSRCTDVRQQSYQLALDNSSDITVFFTIWGSNAKAKGDTVSSYYMYKKGNITYCSIGFSEKERGGQLSSIMKLPEAALIVNSIINSTNTIARPDPDNNTPRVPNIIITNTDKDEYSKTIPAKNTDGSNNMEAIPMINNTDETTQPTDTNVTRVGYTKKTDFFYPDFDFDNAKTSSTSGGSTNPEVDLSIDNQNSYVYNVAGVGPVLKIEFKKDTATTSPAHIDVKAGNVLLDDIVVQYYDSEGNKLIAPNRSINVTGVTDYFIEIPLNNSYYAAKSGITNPNSYGIDSVENFGLVIETILDDYKYGAHTDINIVKRALFQIH